MTPADLAITDRGYRAFRTADGWTYANGMKVPTEEATVPCRPLVVLDPENPDDRARLAQALRASGWASPVVGSIADAMRALLPPSAPVKPPEPTDFGHLITDTNDVQWVLVPNHAARTGAVSWYSHDGRYAKYADIDVAVES